MALLMDVSIKEINRSLKEINRLIRSIKEINSLISKGMSNIYLVPLTKTDVLKTSIFQVKKFISRPAFGELHFLQISLNF